MEVRSTYKYARISPFKAREVTREIQGLPVSAALDLLAFTPKKAAFLISKTLKSAIANAENNANLKPDGLVVKEAIVGEGPTLKRIMALTMVRVATGIPVLSAQRSQDSQLCEEETPVRGCLENCDRASVEFNSSDHSHGASRDCHRTKGRGDRKDDGRNFENGRGQTGQNRYSGNQDAGTRRSACGRKRGVADRKSVV